MLVLITVEKYSRTLKNNYAMFFVDDDNRFLNPEVLHVVHRELYAITSNLEVARYGLRNVPTHTEDGIPIRKLYVSNLPPKTTRTELFNVFAQYGFIKSCWLRMGDKGPNRPPTPTYAFVTYSNPSDAHKALLAPNHEKILRGRNLRISPADSWHQPTEDEDNKVRWKPRGQRRADGNTSSNSALNGECSTESSDPNTSEANSTAVEEDPANGEPSYNILDILNRDCMNYILTFVPIIDLIRSESVSKTWQNMVSEYLHSIRTFKTSWWQEMTLTTAVLRRVLQRLGGSLLRLHINHHLSALNDRTAHSIGKFCPNLEELRVIGMHTKNWNPLIYGCKQLKVLTFISCNKLTDSSLVHLVKNNSCIEELTIANNTNLTGLFLTGANMVNLHSLCFANCYNIQGTVLCAAVDTLPNITALKLDICPVSMWKIIPLILKKLPKLQELSLSEHTTAEACLSPHENMDFCESLTTLTELRSVNFSKNININNAVMKQLAQTCSKLEKLNVACCNSINTFPQVFNAGVNDEGIRAICNGCLSLRRLDVSYLIGLTDDGLRCVAKLPRLSCLIARGNESLTAASVAQCMQACHHLEEVDVCGCDNISEQVVGAAVEALNSRPRALTLRLGGTAAAIQEEFPIEDYPTHKLLTVNMTEDRSSPNLRPDFVDRVFDYSSDDSLDDLYDQELYEVQDFDDFLGGDYSDEDLLELDHDGDELDQLYAFGMPGADIILL